MLTAPALRIRIAAALGLALAGCAEATATPPAPVPAPAPAPVPAPAPPLVGTPPIGLPGSMQGSCVYGHGCSLGGPADAAQCLGTPLDKKALRDVPEGAGVTTPDDSPRDPHLDAVLTAEAREKVGYADACCYTWTLGCMGGRPALADDGPVLAPTVDRGGWAADRSLAGPSDPEARRRMGEAWLEAARVEHSSVAAFAGLALDLIAHGAPADLVAAALAAGADEVRHAEACFAVASALLGRALGPGPMDLSRWKRSETLGELALATFREGCVGEAVAALAAARAAESAEDPEIASIQRTIAEEEAGHAVLAWRIVRWAVGVAGPVDLRGELERGVVGVGGPEGEGLPSRADVASAAAAALRMAGELVVGLG